jgi:lipopolysaccharide export LptBFGC system permease protein LptF
MKILTRHILGQIWTPALLAAVVTSFVVIAGELQRQLNDLFRDVPIAEVTLGDISRIALFVVPVFVGYIIPVTFLLGVLLAFGRMAQASEIVAMKAAGIPLKRLVLPVVAAGLLLSGLCFWIQDQGQPWAYKRLATLLNSDLPLRVRLDMLPTGAMHQYGDWRVFIGRRDADGALRDIVVMQPQPNGRAETLYADRARLVRDDGVISLELEKGHYIPAEEEDRARHITFERMLKTVPGLPARDAERERKGIPLVELLAEEKAITAEYESTKNQVIKQTLVRYRIEVANRIGFPLMCLAVTVVAAPLGARTQRTGRSYLFAYGLGVIVVYFVLRDLAISDSLKPLWETILRGQAANLLLLLAGSVLIWRVDRV